MDNKSSEFGEFLLELGTDINKAQFAHLLETHTEKPDYTLSLRAAEKIAAAVSELQYLHGVAVDFGDTNMANTLQSQIDDLICLIHCHWELPNGEEFDWGAA